MREDFDTRVADRFMVLDDVAVPDTWSRVQHKLLDLEPEDSNDATATMIDLEALNRTNQVSLRRRWLLAAAVLLVVAAAVVLVERDSHEPAVVTTNTPPVTTATVVATTTTPPDTTETVESSFATAIEASGVLISPSAEEIALASDTNLYRLDSGSTQVSAAKHFAAVRQCRTDRPCSAGWAYETGSVDGGQVHHGLLGEADEPAVYVLDDRFFMVMDLSPGSQQAPAAWLIDSVSGGHAQLTWRDEPTTMSAREQMLLVSDGRWSVARRARIVELREGEEYVPGDFPEVFLPRVVDARDGTVRPLAVPDSASADLPVAQNGKGRIWIGTTPGSNHLGLAYSDDGGATWTERALPAQLLANADEPENAAELRRAAFYGDLLLSIAADGDRIAVTDAWWYDGREVYVSGDSGLNWSTVTVANPSRNNGSHLYVLADKRLLLVRSDDPYARHLLVSTGSDWTTLEEDLEATRATTDKYVDVNQAGIVALYYPVEMYDDGTIGGMPDAPPLRHHFSTDLTNWRATPVLDDYPQ